MNNNQDNHNEGQTVYGLAARYSREEDFIAAVRQAVEAGYKRFDTYSPFPIKGLRKIPGYTTRIQWAVFFGGLAGGLGGFFMQYIANVWAYPLDIGGRPFNSWPAFIPISFELTILIASLSGFAALLISCRLPEVHHPMFGVPGFDHVTVDAFFICIRSDDASFDAERTRRFLEGTNPYEIHTAFH